MIRRVLGVLVGVGACALGVLSLGCEPRPDDLSVLSSGVVDSAGVPLASREVILSRSADESCWLQPGALEDAGYAELDRAVTDAEGRVDFIVRGSQVSRHFKESTERYPSSPCLAVWTPPVEGERSSVIGLSPSIQSDFPLPPLVVWTPQWSAAEADGGLELEVAAPAFPGPNGSFEDGELFDQRRHLELRDGDELLWRMPWAARALLPDLALEDHPRAAGQLVIEGYAAISTLTGGLTSYAMPNFQITELASSPPAEVVLPGRVPVSRGRPCLRDGVPLEPCVATDGSFLPVDIAVHLSEYSYTSVAALEIDLQGPVHPRKVLVHWSCSNWPYERRAIALFEGATAIGGPWSALASAELEERCWPPSPFDALQQFFPGTFFALEISAPVPEVTRVRLRVVDPDVPELSPGLTVIGELSVFE